MSMGNFEQEYKKGNGDEGLHAKCFQRKTPEKTLGLFRKPEIV